MVLWLQTCLHRGHCQILDWRPAGIPEVGSLPSLTSPERALTSEIGLPEIYLETFREGPERWNEELKTGKYSPVLKEMKEDLEKAVPGAYISICSPKDLGS